MDIIKTDIHMDCIRGAAVSQVAMEEDVNLPESKPDISFLTRTHGEPVIEEIKAGNDSVTIRGKLVFHVLYYTGEEGGRLVPFEGKVNFEEKLHIDGVSPADTVQVNAAVEDLSVSAIHSRKLNVRAIVLFQGRLNDISRVELPIEVRNGEAAQFRRTPITVSELILQKKDVLRIREEVMLPSGYPNIYQILDSRVSLSDVEYRAVEDTFQVQGDINLCVLYEAEGETRGVRVYEVTIPFGGRVDCPGLTQEMLGDLEFVKGPVKLVSKPDPDGEERSIDLEMSLDIGMNVYEEGQYEMISDLYGVTKEVECRSEAVTLQMMRNRLCGKSKLSGRIHTKEGQEAILQVLFYDSCLTTAGEELTEGKMGMQGTLDVNVMYVTGNDEMPYEVVRESLPYEYSMDMTGYGPEDHFRVKADVEQLQVNMLDGEELEVKAVLTFRVIIWKEIQQELIQNVSVENLDAARQKSLPGIVIYTVRPGDNLWSIGKKYYITEDRIREMNHLSSDELQPGEKLLLSKV